MGWKGCEGSILHLQVNPMPCCSSCACGREGGKTLGFIVQACRPVPPPPPMSSEHH